MSPKWCKVVTVPREACMREKSSQKGSLKVQRRTAIRASISFPPDLYRTLEEIAQQKKVSLAWVVRDAAEKHVADLLAASKKR